MSGVLPLTSWPFGTICLANSGHLAKQFSLTDLKIFIKLISVRCLLNIQDGQFLKIIKCWCLINASRTEKTPKKINVHRTLIRNSRVVVYHYFIVIRYAFQYRSKISNITCLYYDYSTITKVFKNISAAN